MNKETGQSARKLVCHSCFPNAVTLTHHLLMLSGLRVGTDSCRLSVSRCTTAQGKTEKTQPGWTGWIIEADNGIDISAVCNEQTNLWTIGSHLYLCILFFVAMTQTQTQSGSFITLLIWHNMYITDTDPKPVVGQTFPQLCADFRSRLFSVVFLIYLRNSCYHNNSSASTRVCERCNVFTKKVNRVLLRRSKIKDFVAGAGFN